MGCDSAGARTRMSKDEEESVLRMKFLFSWCPEASKTRSQMTEGQAEWKEGWLQAAYTAVVSKREPIQNHLRGSTLFLVKLVCGGT